MCTWALLGRKYAKKCWITGLRVAGYFFFLFQNVLVLLFLQWNKNKWGNGSLQLVNLHGYDKEPKIHPRMIFQLKNKFPIIYHVKHGSSHPHTQFSGEVKSIRKRKAVIKYGQTVLRKRSWQKRLKCASWKYQTVQLGKQHPPPTLPWKCNQNWKLRCVE